MNGFPVAALGWTLIHFVWQGALIGALTQTVLRNRTGPRERYTVALTALLLMPGVLVATFLWLATRLSDDLVVIASQTGFRGPPWLFLIVASWSLGVFLLAIRALIGLWLVHDLRRHSTPLPAEWMALCHVLREKLSVVLPVAFGLSDRIQSPVAAGWFKPMVLLPASVLLRLPADQAEALILHELAHLKRFDPFVNLLQIALETVLFYHPTVWRISRIVRAEREHCCDDMAARALGDPAVVAHALHSVASLRVQPAFVLAASGGAVKSRIARLLGVAPVDEPLAGYWMAAVCLMVTLIIGSTLVWRGSDVLAAPQSPIASRLARTAAATPPSPKAAGHAINHKARRPPKASPASASSAAPVQISHSEIDARLDRLQYLLDYRNSVDPTSRFLLNQEVRALRAEIATLRHQGDDPGASDAG